MGTREGFSWRMILVAFILVLVGLLLMFEGSNMLFEFSSFAILALGLAAILIFSGIVLMVLAVAAATSV